MDELKKKAEELILELIVPDGILDVKEFFDYDLSDEEAIKVYELILEAKVQVSWD